LTLTKAQRDEHHQPIFQLGLAASLVDRLLARLDRSSNSARWKNDRAAAQGLTNPTAAARSLRISPGRVTMLIRTGKVKLHPLDNRYLYVRTKEVKQALGNELASTMD
jgi:hypothetical protein